MLNQVWCVDCVGRSVNSSVPLRAQSYSFSNVVIKRLCLIIKYWNATELSYLEVVLCAVLQLYVCKVHEEHLGDTHNNHF